MGIIGSLKNTLIGATFAGLMTLGAGAWAGPVILSGMDPEDHGSAGVTMIGDIMSFVVGNATNNGAAGTGSNVLMLGPGGPIGGSGTDASSIATGLGYTMTVVSSAAAIGAVDFSGYDAIYMPTSTRDIFNGMTQTQLDAINLRGADIVSFVNAGGGLAAFSQNLTDSYAWFPLGGLTTVDFGSGGGSGITVTAEGSAILSPSATSVSPFHTGFTGPAGFFGLDVLATNSSGTPLIIGGGAETVISASEPGIAAVFGLGLMGLGWARRRRAA